MKSIQQLEGRKGKQMAIPVKHVSKEIAIKDWQAMNQEEKDEHLLSYYSREYKPEYDEALIQHMSTGRSYETFCCKVKCDIGQLYNWEERHVSFYNSKKIAFHKCLEYWENILIDATTDKLKSNASLLIFKLKNSFPDLYSDKVELQHSGQVVFNFDTGIVRTPKTIETKDYTILSDDSDML